MMGSTRQHASQRRAIDRLQARRDIVYIHAKDAADRRAAADAWTRRQKRQVEGEA